jgi:hypothetical protein
MTPTEIHHFGSGLLPTIMSSLLGRGNIRNVVDDQQYPPFSGLPNTLCPPSICDPTSMLDPASTPVQNSYLDIHRFFWLGMAAALLDNIEFEILEEEN